MGAHKKIGISKEYRDIARKYIRRYRLSDYRLVLSRASGNRIIYLYATDDDGIEYRIRFDKVRRMRRPKGIQVVNKRDYFIHQADEVHGFEKYDYSLIKEEDITFHNKLDIICKIHGVFKKRKAAFITERGGCPKCAKKIFNYNRKFE